MFLGCAVPFLLHGSGAECPAVLGRCGQEKGLPFNPTSASGLIFPPRARKATDVSQSLQL